MEYKEERISRTAGNVYQKADWDTWLLYPRGRNPYTFCNILNYIIFDEPEIFDKDMMQYDINKIKKEIREQISFCESNDFKNVKVKKK